MFALYETTLHDHLTDHPSAARAERSTRMLNSRLRAVSAAAAAPRVSTEDEEDEAHSAGKRTQGCSATFTASGARAVFVPRHGAPWRQSGCEVYVGTCQFRGPPARSMVFQRTVSAERHESSGGRRGSENR